jgi:predicted nucleic acid-binding protein
MAISIVTWAELRVGMLYAHNERRRELEQWLDVTVPKWLEQRILALTIDVLTEWLEIGRILAARGINREATDLLIASTARTHNLIVVSRNVRDFANTGVVVYDPWSGKTHRMDAP